jgi:3-methyladenine DNA glycosylase Mpg
VQSFHDVDLNVQLVAVEVEEYRHDDGAGNQLSERTERVRPMPVMPGR